MNIQNGVPPSSRGRSAGGKIFVPPPIQLLSRGIPPLSPSDSVAFHLNWPPASAHLHPTSSNPALARIPFLAFRVLMNHSKHERRGLSIFCRWKRPGWHIFADNEKCFGFFTVGLPPAPHPPPLQAKKANSTFFLKSPSAPRPRLWEFLTGEHLKNMINFKCTIKATILCIGHHCCSQRG